MRIRVLGAAAGGGFPQWNAASLACRRARAGDPTARPATQASIALSAESGRWVLVNASPDLRQQIEANDVLHPREGHPKDGLRSSPIAAVLLTNGDVDAIAGGIAAVLDDDALAERLRAAGRARATTTTWEATAAATVVAHPPPEIPIIAMSRAPEK